MRTQRLGTCLLLVATLALTGCAGLSLPTPSAPAPSSSYPTVDAGDAASEQCREVVGQLNELSRGLAQLGEAFERGDLLVGVSLLSSLQEQIGELGGEVQGDPDLQQRLDGVRAAAEALGGALATASDDPLAALGGVQGEVDALGSAIQEVVEYCDAS